MHTLRSRCRFLRLVDRVLGSEFVLQSKFVIILVEVGWLKQATDLRKTLSLGCLCCDFLLFLFLREKLGIIPCEFFQLNQEITKIELKSIWTGIKGK